MKTPSSSRSTVASSLAIGVAILLFGLSVRGRPLPALISILALLIACALILRTLLAPAGPAIAFGTSRSPRRTWFSFLLAAAFGLLLALYWRWARGVPLLPDHLTLFILTAALIGTTEELIFRGFIQGGLAPLTPTGAILIASALHSAYKASLFLSPAPGENVSLVVLLIGTFLGGIAFGALRQLSGTVWPCILAHALFDILGYGDHPSPPTWIWN